LKEHALTMRFRLLGFLPLLFFLGQGLHYWQIDQLGHMLWMCNIGNLLLSLGMFLDEPALIRIAVIWAIPGAPIWMRYVVTEWFHYSVIDWSAVAASSFAHVGGLIVGLFALARVRMDRAAWFHAFVWFLILQVVSRLATPAELNVNVSHYVYESWQKYFSSYWKFWMAMALIVGIGLWLLSSALNGIWPRRAT
jgi:hypothetical protein